MGEVKNEVKVLIEGYAKKTSKGWIASSTVTLVRNNSKNIIIDPGCSRQVLIKELAKHGLKPRDIDFVFLTHNHTDHALLAGIFENAKVLNTYEIYDGDNQTEHGGKIPGTGLEILQTPGHAPEHASLVVPTANGTYVIAGDCFWWTDEEEQITDVNKIDDVHPEEADMKELVESRMRVLEIADYVIPGHGKTFKVEK